MIRLAHPSGITLFQGDRTPIPKRIQMRMPNLLRCAARTVLLVLSLGTVGAVATLPAALAQNRDLHAYCSGPGKDYRECMKSGEMARSLSPGLRNLCSRPGTNFNECVERYVGRSSIDDMSAYCSQPGRVYRNCMDQFLQGGNGSGNYDRNNQYGSNPNYERDPYGRDRDHGRWDRDQRRWDRDDHRRYDPPPRRRHDHDRRRDWHDDNRRW